MHELTAARENTLAARRRADASQIDLQTASDENARLTQSLASATSRLSTACALLSVPVSPIEASSGDDPLLLAIKRQSHDLAQAQKDLSTLAARPSGPSLQTLTSQLGEAKQSADASRQSADRAQLALAAADQVKLIAQSALTLLLTAIQRRAADHCTAAE